MRWTVRHSAMRGVFGGIGLGAFCLSGQSGAAQEVASVPAWLAAHVGQGNGQIAPPVLARARALYLRKVGEGVVRNSCYFAMDATAPNNVGDGGLARRFYEICEDHQVFRAIPAGHGAGRDLEGVANFSNGRQCAKNFGNALDSYLTTGGGYMTAETRATFKGYFRAADGQDAPLVRSFIQFDGEGETADARARAIGGHASVTIKGACLRQEPGSPYANAGGYVPFGTFVDYTGGRSDGCTSWSPSDTSHIVALVQNSPTTLYIYPDAADVAGVAQAIAGGRVAAKPMPYWNATCLKQIGAPRYWSNEIIAPLLAKYRRLHPPPPPRPTPLCGAP